MAKINARGAYQLAAFTTEVTRNVPGSGVKLTRESYSETRRERWVLRSDGKVLHRIVHIEDPTYRSYDPKHPHRLVFSSGLSIKATINDPAKRNADWLREYLVRKGFTIVREG